MNKEYIGDGVYAEIEDEMVALTTNRGGLVEVIYLEPGVLGTFLNYIDRWYREHGMCLIIKKLEEEK